MTTVLWLMMIVAILTGAAFSVTYYGPSFGLSTATVESYRAAFIVAGFEVVLLGFLIDRFRESSKRKSERHKADLLYRALNDRFREYLDPGLEADPVTAGEKNSDWNIASHLGDLIGVAVNFKKLSEDHQIRYKYTRLVSLEIVRRFVGRFEFLRSACISALDNYIADAGKEIDRRSKARLENASIAQVDWLFQWDSEMAALFENIERAKMFLIELESFTGHPIDSKSRYVGRSLEVSRRESLNEYLYGLKLTRSDFEHLSFITFDNFSRDEEAEFHEQHYQFGRFTRTVEATDPISDTIRNIRRLIVLLEQIGPKGKPSGPRLSEAMPKAIDTVKGVFWVRDGLIDAGRFYPN